MHISYRMSVISTIVVMFVFIFLPPLSAQNPPAVSGNSVGDFLTPDGRFDLEKARMSGFQGSLNMDGFASNIDPATGQPVFHAAAKAATNGSPDDVYWDNSMSPSVVGVMSPDNVYEIRALTIYNGKLIVGGYFTFAGTIPVNSIAAWDGVSWSPLGSGLNGKVLALIVYNGKLIAGGRFTTAGGKSADYIAAWDGTDWSSLSEGMNGYVYSLLEYEGKLIAGGWFTTAGGVGANNIAAWDGISWTPLGKGVNSYVWTLVLYKNELIIGGYFTDAGEVQALHIASWDGTSWKPLGKGVNQISALAVFDGKLIAGGDSPIVEGVSASNVASWDGSSWAPLGSRMDLSVFSLFVFDNKLVAGGNFTSAGGVSAQKVAIWDGVKWSPLGDGLHGGRGDYGEVRTFAVYDGKLVAGGAFGTANGIAEWDGKEWMPFGDGIDNVINAITVYNGKLIVGGDFITAGGRVVNGIAAWDGYHWSPLGNGISDYSWRAIGSLTVYNGKLIAVGSIYSAGGVINNCAAWDGSSWSSLGWVVQGHISAFTVYNGKLIAGGRFTSLSGIAVNNIAAWDGTTWSPLGKGTDGIITALTEYGGKLIAGGQFRAAGDVSTHNIAAWDGNSWSSLGDGFKLDDYINMTPIVSALTVYEGKLIAGGTFSIAGGVSVSGVAAWDGSEWSALGERKVNYRDAVYSLAVFDKKLFIGLNNNIAIWDGISWSSPGSGITGDYTIGTDEYMIRTTAFSLVVYNNALIVGGWFSEAGGKLALNIARWTKISSPEAVSEPPALPSPLFLSPAFPNPFNPSTTIDFSIPADSRVTVKVFNLAGQEVAALKDEMMPAGRHTVTWDAKGMPSGVYFCTVKAGKFSETRKMTLVK